MHAQLHNLSNWARLLLSLAHDDLDHSFAKDNIQVITLVDSDIVHFHADPLSAGYFEALLPSDSHEQVRALGRYLAIDTFERNPENGNQFRIAPPHFLEVLNKSLEIEGRATTKWNTFLDQGASPDLPLIRRWLDDPGGTKAPGKEVGAYRALTALLGGPSTIGDLERAKRLGDWCKDYRDWLVGFDVESAARAQARGGVRSPSQIPEVWPKMERGAQRDVFRFWLEQLKRSSRSFDTKARDNVDAQVLAGMCILNFDWQKKGRRFHLLTGSTRINRAMFRTALRNCDEHQLLQPELNAQWLASSARNSAPMEYLGDFLRTPYCILASPRLWAPAQHSSTKGNQSLRAIVETFPQAARYLYPLSQRSVRQLQVQAFNVSEPDTPQEQRRFQRLFSHRGPDSLHDTLKHDAAGKLSQLVADSATLKNIKNLLNGLDARRWTQLREQLQRANSGNALRDAIFSRLSQSENAHRQDAQIRTFDLYLKLAPESRDDGALRASPRVDFGSFVAARALSESIVRYWNNFKSADGLNDPEITLLQKKALIEDPTSYCFVLAYSDAIARCGQKRTALHSARYACAISQSHDFAKTRSTHIHGEEAWLLQTALTRQTAESEQVIDSALARLLEFERQHAKVIDDSDRIRLNVEASSLRLARLCFEFFNGAKSAAAGTLAERLKAETRRSECVWEALEVGVHYIVSRAILAELRIRCLSNRCTLEILSWLVKNGVTQNGPNFDLGLIGKAVLPTLSPADPVVLAVEELTQLLAQLPDSHNNKVARTTSIMASLLFAPHVANWSNVAIRARLMKELDARASSLEDPGVKQMRGYDDTRINLYLAVASCVCGLGEYRA